MAEIEAFKIEKVVVKVATDFIKFDNETYEWKDFNENVELLKKLEEGSVVVDDFSRNWLEEWEARGVIERFSYKQAEFYAADSWVSAMKKGPRFEHFMQAVKGFEVKMEAEMEARAIQRRREQIERELASLGEGEHTAQAEPASPEAV